MNTLFSPDDGVGPLFCVASNPRSLENSVRLSPSATRSAVFFRSQNDADFDRLGNRHRIPAPRHVDADHAMRRQAELFLLGQLHEVGVAQQAPNNPGRCRRRSTRSCFQRVDVRPRCSRPALLAAMASRSCISASIWQEGEAGSFHSLRIQEAELVEFDEIEVEGARVLVIALVGLGCGGLQSAAGAHWRILRQRARSSRAACETARFANAPGRSAMHNAMRAKRAARMLPSL